MKKNRVGISTILSLNNYGAVFQSFALVSMMRKLGYDPEIIDYRLPKDNDFNTFVQVKRVKDILRNLRILLHYTKYKKRQKLFKEFIDVNIPLSPQFYSMDEKDILGRYDYLCTGSDQTFNVLLNAFKKEFFLNFTSKLPKFSYASSLGEECSKFSQNDKLWISQQLKEYYKISTREQQGVKLLQEITGRDDIEKVLDPTLLLSEEFWKSMLYSGDKKNSAKNNDKYILFYSVLSDRWVVDKVISISKYLKLPVISPHMPNKYELGRNINRFIECGPLEFLNIIENAELILTTSFHATVFAFIFKKNFYSFILGEGNRIGDFLKKLGLQNRIISKLTDNIIFENIDYTEPIKKISIEQKRSISFLKDTLSNLDEISGKYNEDL